MDINFIISCKQDNNTNLLVTGPDRRSATGTATARKVIFQNIPTVNADLRFSFFLRTFVTKTVN